MVKNYPKNGSWNALINGSSSKKVQEMVKEAFKKWFMFWCFEMVPQNGFCLIGNC